MTIRIGLSGWSYQDWVGPFYPEDLPSRKWLSYVAHRFTTVEINRSFYSLVRPEIYRGWRTQVPNDFTFSVKGSRYITHMKRLRNIETPLANFLASGVLELGDRLGPLLWQLPRTRRVDPAALVDFLEMLPPSTQAAAAIASGHDHRVGDFCPPEFPSRPVRHALELRHPDSLPSAVIEAARAHNIAIVLSQASQWPLFEETTADFTYIRLHGPRALYTSAYSEAELDDWARRIECRAAHQDVLVYFDNDSGAHAPRDAAGLMDRLSGRERSRQ